MSDGEGRSRWQPVKDMMTGPRVALGNYSTYQFLRSPRRVLFSLSYYKFAAKALGPGRRVLDVGCGEGIGTWLLAKECGEARGMDIDEANISIARENWTDSAVSFDCADFLALEEGRWTGLVSLDVIEHIQPRNVGRFWNGVARGLESGGIAVIGTPNMTSDRYASDVTRLGHVNLYTADRLEREMRERFAFVFMFGANDEVIHTGFPPMAHYLLAVGVIAA